MLMLSRVRDHLSHLGLRNLISKDPTDSFTLGMHLQHNASCFGAVHCKEALQDIDHELQGSVVVIDQHNLIEWRALELGRRFFDDQARPIPPTFNVTHESLVYRVPSRRLQDMQTKPSGNALSPISINFNKKNKCLSDQAGSPYDYRSHSPFPIPMLDSRTHEWLSRL